MITFRLIGVTEHYQIKIEGKGILNLKEIHDIFLKIRYGNDMNNKHPSHTKFREQLNKIKFITNGRIIESGHTINVEDSKKPGYKPVIIHIFAMSDVKEIMKKLFKEKGEPVEKKGKSSEMTKKGNDLNNPVLSSNIDSLDSKVIELDKDERNKRMEIFKELSNSPEFIMLLGLYFTRPELFRILLGFIESGTIVAKDSERLQEAEDGIEVDYSDELNELKKFNLDIQDETILFVLKKYNGNLNMSLRYLICTKGILEANLSTVDNLDQKKELVDSSDAVAYAGGKTKEKDSAVANLVE